MRKLIWLLIIGLLVFTGCLETTQEYFINPDNSGKMIMDLKMNPAQGMGQQAQINEESMRQQVSQMISQTEGIRAWSDVSWEKTEDGAMHIQATAYFDDINKVNSKQNPMNLSFGKNADEKFVLEVVEAENPQQMPGQQQSKYEGKEWTEEELDAEVKKIKSQYNQQKMMLSMFLSNFKNEQIFHLPGKVEETTNFKKAGEKSVTLTVSGSQLLATMDEMMADEQYLKEQLKKGKDPMSSSPEDTSEFNKMMFGEKGAIKTVAGQGQPLFNYKSEVKAAESEFRKLKQELNLAQESQMNTPFEMTAEKEETEDVNNAEIETHEDSAEDEKTFDRSEYSKMMKQALTHRRRNEYEKAVEIYQTLAENESIPEKFSAGAQYRKASCYMRMKDYQKALEEFKYLIKKFPEQEYSVKTAKRRIKVLEKYLEKR